MSRYVSISFRSLSVDWFIRRQPALANIAFVLAAPDHGRLMVTATNRHAAREGIVNGMTVADARALLSGLEVLDDKPELVEKALTGLATFCIRFTPLAAIDLPDGLTLDVTGCPHLWKGEQAYLVAITERLQRLGYNVSAAMADTIGAAWAAAHFAKNNTIIESGEQASIIVNMPAAALRLNPFIVERLEKLGLHNINAFIGMPRSTLRRRFGNMLLERIDQALGVAFETITPVETAEVYQERMPCLEPIVTATGITIALESLLNALCIRLQKEEKGLRIAVLKCYRIDGKMIAITIGTNHPSCNSKHLFKLFEIKIDTIEPALGIELFTLDALKVEDVSPLQNKLWGDNNGLSNVVLAELLDRIAGKTSNCQVHRYVPAEHYWPERSFTVATELHAPLAFQWTLDRPRPLRLLNHPEPIQVTAPVPDYPPMNFRYKGVLHKIIKADGPERIEQEWWLQEGQHRDYYVVENEEGQRYWLFRSGHYDEAKTFKWFIHGFFG